MARIIVNLGRPLGAVHPFVFGQFIEHMHRCIYGGVYEEGSPLSDAAGYRKDVMEAIRGLGATILRWPGGNFVSGYHWEDGVGPKDQRPRRLELAWPTPGGTVETNRFGTDEFIQYCRLLNTEPYICINLGTGSLDEARNWVEYCNGTTDTFYANLRRRNGHPEPYNVRYWGLGNEMYGAWQQGAKTAEEYARFAREAAKLMKGVDPSIKLIACGHDGVSDWDRAVLEVLAPYVDYHSIHIYTGSDDYYTNVFLPHQAERCIRHMSALIEGIRFRQRISHPIPIAYDEWNVWHFNRAVAENGYQEPYNLGDALAVATYLNIFLRMPAQVGMANLAQTVNVLGSMITNPKGLYLQTIYHPISLYAKHCGPVALDSYVVAAPDEQHTLAPDAGPSAERVADLGPFGYLDVSATHNPDARTATVCVVNRHRERAITASLDLLDGQATRVGQVYEVNGSDPDVSNSFEHPDAVTVHEKAWQGEGSRIAYTFPAHSVTVLKFSYQ